MNKTKISILLLVVLISFGFKSTSKQYLAFDYEDFGPQVIAHEMLGMQWWQWDKHGDSDPNTKYDIKIVVYRDISLKEIESLFPVSQEKKKDYRYIEYEKAVTYLDENINELSDAGEEWEVTLKNRLTTTRKRIEEYF